MLRNQGVIADTLFVGMTRPPMLWGVTYAAVVVNVIMTMEAFIVTKNLLWLLAFAPIHGIFYLVCLYEPMFFDLFQLWGRTRGVGFMLGNVRFWKASSYSPVALDCSGNTRRRRALSIHVVI